MTKDQIIAMARSAGAVLELSTTPDKDMEFLKKFAQLVTTQEREANAQICDRFQARHVGMQPAECAAAIRARK